MISLFVKIGGLLSLYNISDTLFNKLSQQIETKLVSLVRLERGA
jgi:hypothetical protein